ncbi:uncharacterized protein BO97DRAFT_439429 [Aspergillus homomorphus CBS 101889]|uniref:Serine-threonine/tyrosine-protein kinase catalytic domain-containing protein n=1 Tax=Aspergillus homomorphus (strain CBS 101889) TaxID=1450537 RepID=A0A395IEG3_ASPHC|nr:hypothetical protein BO97DRAFT_439429 [Aspergillus homomorphus CBS 101889]RAL17548.1 hypothetical protein BO97DRAFT_439429 [Aspergillus homomorphus CBS 101889]
MAISGRILLNPGRPMGFNSRGFREISRTLDYIHDRRVLVADIASRNFLLNSDLSLKICDFSKASLLPLDSDMEAADDHGHNIQIDIDLLRAVIYEVVTGNKCQIIEGCWNGEFRSAHCLSEALKFVHLRCPSPMAHSHSLNFLDYVKVSIKERSATTIVSALGLTIVILIVGGRGFLKLRDFYQSS